MSELLQRLLDLFQGYGLDLAYESKAIAEQSKTLEKILKRAQLRAKRDQDLGELAQLQLIAGRAVLAKRSKDLIELRRLTLELTLKLEVDQ
jgi:hypothetical protein